ncbi:hypothetical protein O6P43_031057 [Quillaja saponaria]|uniref:Uncharacterized protein n=1 Tax=Quillaja saponaria TaxID=32244 RepID=A0AAD7KUK0_QUISA|nr:hypothetical protein O6P43_031057 [Quillaja saponaria]
MSANAARNPRSFGRKGNWKRKPWRDGDHTLQTVRLEFPSEAVHNFLLHYHLTFPRNKRSQLQETALRKVMV